MKPKKPEKPIPYKLAVAIPGHETKTVVFNDSTRGAPGNDGQYVGSVQPIDLIGAQNLDFYEGNIVKYVCRWRKKGGLRDLEKARQYLDWLIDRASIPCKTTQETSRSLPVT